MYEIANLLEDESSWARLNAIIALANYKFVAKDLLPRIKASGEDITDEHLIERVTKRIAETEATIEKSTAEKEAAKVYGKKLETIRQFCESRDE